MAVGHSAADGPAVAEAAHAGATLSTHLGNGLAQHHHKFANPLFAQLSEDRLHATFIADGIHIPPGALQVLLRAKSIARSILVTDAVAAAASPPGTYPFAGMIVERSYDGTVRLPRSPYLAGSSLTMDAAVRNVVAWDLCNVEEAIAMATTIRSRRWRGLCAITASVVPAGRVAWDRDLRVEGVGIDGRHYLK